MSLQTGSPEHICKNHVRNTLMQLELMGSVESKSLLLNPPPSDVITARTLLRRRLLQIVELGKQHPESASITEAAAVAEYALNKLPRRPGFAFSSKMMSDFHAKLQLISILEPQRDRSFSLTNRISEYFQ